MKTRRFWPPCRYHPPIILSAVCIVANAHQLSGQVPVEARNLIVQLWAYQEGRSTPKVGSGFVIGLTDTEVYVATAGHVVLSPDTGGVRDTLEIRVAFRADSARGIAATRELPRANVHVATHNETVDLAVISVARSSIPRWVTVTGLSLNRIGHAGEGHRVFPVGCGQRGLGCWTSPALPEVVQVRAGDLIGYQTQVTSKGHSGGALFNKWGEIAGMIIETERSLGTAQAIDFVLDTIKNQGYPVNLKKARVPRAGLRWAVDYTHLWPINENQFLSPDDLPLGEDREELPPESGRLAVSRRAFVSERLLVSGHLALLRLAPMNLSVGGGFVGLQAVVRLGPIGIGGFGEVGAAHIESQYDAGGFYSSGSQELNGYVPYWNQVEDDGLGAGFGGRLEVTVFRFLILQGTIGKWAFSMPENAQPLPQFFLGLGARIGS